MRPIALAGLLVVVALAPGCLEYLPGGEARSASLVLVRSAHYLNATEDRPVHAAFGPHCADAEYALDPPRVTLRTEDEDAPEGVLVWDHRAWGDARRGNASVLTTSADGVGARPFDRENATLPLRSAFTRNGSWEERPVLVTLTFQGGEARLDGEPLPEGESRVLRLEASWLEEGVRYEATEILEVEHLGSARVGTEPPGLCA